MVLFYIVNGQTKLLYLILFLSIFGIKNFKITSYNKLDQITTNDVSYVNLTRSPPGIDKYNIQDYPIPKNYKLTRKSNLNTTFDLPSGLSFNY